MDIATLDEWEKARHYIAWAKRQGFSSATVQEIPLMKEFSLTDQDREILHNLEKLAQ